MLDPTDSDTIERVFKQYQTHQLNLIIGSTGDADTLRLVHELRGARTLLFQLQPELEEKLKEFQTGVDLNHLLKKQFAIT